MEFYLVEFACFANDKIRMFLLDEQKHSDWCMNEPQQGYKHFKTIWHGDIDQIVYCGRSALAMQGILLQEKSRGDPK